MTGKLQKVFLMLILVFNTLPSSQAATSHNVAAGANADINEHGVCRNVANSNGKAMMVATNSTTAWNNFRTNVPPNVTVSACSSDYTPDAINWASFSNGSTVGTFTGVNATLSVQLSVAHVSGTPTYEYRKNGGAWTAFSPGSPATVSIVNNDTLEFQITGTNSNSGTITVTNTSDSNTVIDTATGTVVIGAFVLSSSYYGANLGSRANANATCVANLTAGNWLNKSGYTIDAAHVFAFICDETACNNLQANTKYVFAKSGSDTVGGATFTTNGSGAGPNDSGDWGATTYWDVSNSVAFWSARAEGTATTWGTTPVAGKSCTNWTINSGGANKAVVGSPDMGDQWRWNNGDLACGSGTVNLVCYVNP